MIVPAVAPAGTTAVSRVGERWLTVVAATPPKLTAELLLKPRPLIVTTVPGDALPGDCELTESVGEKLVELVPLFTGVVTEIGAVTVPLGAVASISVEESTLKIAEASRSAPRWPR